MQLETRRRWLGSDRPYVVWVDKLSQRRNIPKLIEAFSIVKRRTALPHALLLFGPNHLELPLDDLVERLGVADDVVQTDGVVSEHIEVARVHDAADLYVSASDYEGFSLTMVEAMACGTPVVAVARAAQKEIVNGAGLLVEESEPVVLADAIQRVLEDDALRNRLRRAGLERAKLFRWEDTARQTLAVLRETAEGGVGA